MRLGLQVNAGANKEAQFNGRDKDTQRQIAAERRGDALELVHVDPEKVSQAIAESRNSGELKQKLKEQGIEAQFRWRDGEVYAWKLRNEGIKEWTSGSKLVPGNEFGWSKVQAQLDKNFEDRKPIKPSRRHPVRRRGLDLTRQPQQPRRIDQATDAAMAEAFKHLQAILNAAASHRLDDDSVVQVKKPIPPTQPTRRPATRRPAKKTNFNFRRPKP